MHTPPAQRAPAEEGAPIRAPPADRSAGVPLQAGAAGSSTQWGDAIVADG
jgi:hypothetical protein